MVDEPSIDPRIVRSEYNARAEIWENSDLWHAHTYTRLSRAIDRVRLRLNLDSLKILNVGSAGSSYGISSESHFYVDIADALLPRNGMSAASTAERLPFASASFDAVMCVGSVINYCDAVPVCREAARVLKPGGWLVLEFESSESGEYLFRMEFGRMVAFVTTTYLNQPEKIWLYSPKYLRVILESVDLKLISDEGFHSITALAFRISRDLSRAMNYAKMDELPLLGRLLRKFACNRIFLAQKSA